jgi:hypothetical protein
MSMIPTYRFKALGNQAQSILEPCATHRTIRIKNFALEFITMTAGIAFNRFLRYAADPTHDRESRAKPKRSIIRAEAYP